MSSLNTVMDNSLSAMFMAQAGMSTTSHNIANADTPGYTRQMNMLAARRPLSFPFGAIGQGVDVVTIRRSQDDFLLSTLRAQKAKQSSYGAIDILVNNAGIAISGPLLDRIDIHIEVPAVPFKELSSAAPGTSSVDMREQVVDVPPQEVITRDNAMVRVDGVAFFQVLDAPRASYEVTDLERAILNLTMTNIRTVMGSMDLDELLSQRDQINARLLTVVDEATFEDPHRYASGIRHVLVNGEPVVADGRHTGARPGRVLRRS